MDLRAFEALLTPDGQAPLAEAVEMRHDGDVSRLFRRLTKLEEQSDIVRAALEIALLRMMARAKFTHADAMYFTREALELSTAETVARHRARRFAGFEVVGDLCCGIGGDAIALAGVARVVAVDRDPLRLAMTGQNLLAHGCRDRVELRQADLNREPPPEAAALFFDPSRRPAGADDFVRDCEPPLDLVRSWLARTPAIAVSSRRRCVTDLATFDAETEFVSLEGELKECVLWFGPLRTAGRRATLLPTGDTLAVSAPAPAAPPGSLLAYLYDPDPAVVRAGLVSDLACCSMPGRLMPASHS
jgi:SAM-dependent methyltransferase